MKTNFLIDTNQNPEMSPLQPSPAPQEPEWESVEIIVIGSSEGVNNVIRTQYRLGFAEVTDWSSLQPAQNRPGKVMSVLVKQISTQP